MRPTARDGGSVAIGTTAWADILLHAKSAFPSLWVMQEIAQRMEQLPREPMRPTFLTHLPRLIIGFIFTATLTTCNSGFLSFNKLEQIKRAGILHVLTRNDPTTYYESHEGYTGLVVRQA
jgi:hypothetical protein